MADLRVNIAGVAFKNPVIAASGCYGFGEEYEAFYPASALGGISLKGTTLEPRLGNPVPRVAETPAGMLNSVGLQNPGADEFLKVHLPRIRNKDTVLIANIAGSITEDYIAIAQRLDESEIDMLELNISCPNVKAGGASFGTSCGSAAQITAQVRRVTKKPLMVKLTPNVTDIAEIAKAVEAEGADAVSLINTLLGMRIDIHSRRPVLRNNVGGLSGPAVFPVALRMVWQVAQAVQIPVVGLGGIATHEDAIEMLMAGASAIQVGTAMFTDPFAPVKIIEGMNVWLDERGIGSAGELTGTVRPW